jgi:DEAD/DEAH box helicase domain-containing protein
MLDFLLLRPEDRVLWKDNGPDTLRYLVLDELHTYDGAQGSDVACLVRRLRTRLRVAAGSLACVGTSATIGSGREGESGTLLREFATKLFGEPFEEGSIVLEARCEEAEIFTKKRDLHRIPSADEVRRLDPNQYENASTYVTAQAELWLGSGAGGLDPVKLAELLERHETVHQLLLSMIAGIQTLTELAEDIARFDDEFAGLPFEARPRALTSLLSLIAGARRREGAHLVPFLTTQVQLWTRELRRLVRRVPSREAPVDEVVLSWAEDVDEAAEEKFLPIVHCRSCGIAGFGAMQRDDEPRLSGRTEDVGRAYLTRSREARVVLLGAVSDDGGEVAPEHMCPTCLALGSLESCPRGHGASLRVTVGRDLSEDPPKRFLARCPACQTDGAIRLLGARAPSLSSVAIAHLFASPFNQDKKLLAFTDSVQDASHLAGFFGNRAYRFNLRVALQSALEASEDDVPLPAIAGRLLGHWIPFLGAQKAVAIFVPPDLADLVEAKAFLRRGGVLIPTALREKLELRLNWESTLEFGYHALIGRSLERTGCATAAVDGELLAGAARALSTKLEEERTLGNGPVDGAAIHAFLAGVVHRLRTNGAIHHPFLDAYVAKDGHRFELSKVRQPLISPFAPDAIPFRFFYSRQGHDVFESHQSRTDRASWVRDWAARCLGVDRHASSVNLLYLAAMSSLVRAGVVREIETHGKGRAAAIEPEAIMLTRRLRRLVCPICRRALRLSQAVASAWTGHACPAYRCLGKVVDEAEEGRSYYARRYRSGRLEPIFAAEHTGLLARKKRQRLEEDFKAGRAPNAPNLLTCTPTLEMGIDIGDLSAALLCSTPPTASNYVQRVGRAGRKTGNALTLAMALARPHDLYFFTEPKEMMAGDMVPPGCFLDAPEILRRQIVAFAMDAWARDDADAGAIPGQTSAILGGGRREFPGRFLSFYRKHWRELFDTFCSLFSPYLTDKSRERLLAHAQPDEVVGRVDGAFDGVAEEVRELQRVQARLQERLQLLDREASTIADPEHERVQTASALRVTERLTRDLRKKYPINVLTDAGVLPNYAFPEPGVTLRSAVRDVARGTKKGPKGNRKGLQTFEYLRPASVAIREFAPFNTFYAEGRKVQITQIDVGTDAHPLVEHWRFCRACAHTHRVQLEETPAGACPRCSDAGWSDTGQVRAVVHFKRASALSDALASAASDESDDRVRQQYSTIDLIDVGSENWHGAQVIVELPFGFELLSRVKLREVNLGSPAGKEKLVVAGSCQPGDGFLVCKDCGRVGQPTVAKAGTSAAIDHAPSCVFHKARTPRTEPVFLYREIESEALRILLPVATVHIERARASFQAAMHLGIRKTFRGNPAHLMFRTMSEPVAGDETARRTFLVVYDTVPGGTGYLAELGRPERFFAVLRVALATMSSCRCRADSQRDGCYRCVYAHALQRDLKNISARLAMDQLGDILAAMDKLEPRRTLSEVDLDTRLESDLERRFLERLLEWAEASGWSVSTIMREGAEAHLIAGPDRQWIVRPQVDLGERQGVAVATRPDFLIQPVGAGELAKPIAVYCDGFKYHALPRATRGRIADDVDKRLAILHSGRYRVWSVTWKDIDASAGEASAEVVSFFDGVRPDQVGHTVQTMKEVRAGEGAAADGIMLPRDLHVMGSMALLTQYLGAPDDEAWTRAVQAILVTALTREPQPEAGALDALEHALTFLKELGSPGALPVAKSPLFGWLRVKAAAALLLRVGEGSLQKMLWGDIRAVLRLRDEMPQRAAEDFERGWRAALHALNLLQFHDALEVVTSEQLASVSTDASTGSGPAVGLLQPRTRTSRPPAGPTKGLAEAQSADPRCAALLSACEAAGAPIPEVLGDVSGGRGRVIATPELSWPAARVAVLASDDEGERAALEKAEWLVLVLPCDAGAVLTAVRSRTEGV